MTRTIFFLSILLINYSCKKDQAQTENLSEDKKTEVQITTDKNLLKTWADVFPNIWIQTAMAAANKDPSTVTYEEFITDVASKIKVTQEPIAQVEKKIENWKSVLVLKCYSNFCTTNGASGSGSFSSVEATPEAAESVHSPLCEFAINSGVEVLNPIEGHVNNGGSLNFRGQFYTFESMGNSPGVNLYPDLGEYYLSLYINFLNDPDKREIHLSRRASIKSNWNSVDHFDIEPVLYDVDYSAKSNATIYEKIKNRFSTVIVYRRCYI